MNWCRLKLIFWRYILLLAGGTGSKLILEWYRCGVIPVGYK